MKTKRILISLGIIGVVAAAVIGGTIAYFNDTETSTGNIFTAGSIDLKVDHVAQSYNGVDCKTCSVTVISDETNMVTEKNEVPLTPYPAVFAWTHTAWTAEEDPILDAAGAEWIWEDNPTKQADTTTDTSYTFEKTFEWWGPIVNTDLYMAVGSDNSVKVYLNNVLIGENTGEYGYREGSMLHIPAANITANINQGTNTLEFIVKNWAMSNGTPYNNPAGLVYKFSIDGNCGDDYFRNHCTLWGEKDLDEGDTFFNFDDVKSGDIGINVISLRVNDNDAYVCLIVHDDDDQENTLLETEESAGDAPNQGNDLGFGELSDYIDIFVWEDLDGDGDYEPTGESSLYEGSIQTELVQMSLTGGGPTEFIGLAWCAGDIVVNHTNGDISCDGNGMLDDAQSDSFEANLTLYAEQIRNNSGFNCIDAEARLNE